MKFVRLRMYLEFVAYVKIYPILVYVFFVLHLYYLCFFMSHTCWVAPKYISQVVIYFFPPDYNQLYGRIHFQVTYIFIIGSNLTQTMPFIAKGFINHTLTWKDVGY